MPPCSALVVSNAIFSSLLTGLHSIRMELAPVYFFFRGTLAPDFLASDNPIAIACFRLFTFLPDRPERSFPRYRSCIARSTFFCAFFPYLAISDLL